MARVTLKIDSATAEEARAFVLAFQTTRNNHALPPQLTRTPIVEIVGEGWHVTTPALTPGHAADMAADVLNREG